MRGGALVKRRMAPTEEGGALHMGGTTTRFRGGMAEVVLLACRGDNGGRWRAGHRGDERSGERGP